MIKEISMRAKVSLLGYSWGRILSCIYIALTAAQQSIQNLVLHSAHIDFGKDDSIAASWFCKISAREIRQKFVVIDTSSINLAREIPPSIFKML